MTNRSVFVSYAHESPEHRAAVRALAEWLIERGIAAITDHPYEDRPPEIGWQAWMLQNIEDADVVLVVCSPKLKARYEKREAPSVGLGATYEGAIVTQSIYDAAQRNTKFFPIVPDGGDRRGIPLTLRPFDNNHRFPSGNERILRLITDEIKVPKPRRPLEAPFESQPPGALRGARDNRLEPREGQVYGRESEIEDVLEFLRGADRSAVVCAQVTGTGGIGKTEVCKAALKRWLSEAPHQRAYYVDIPDRAGADDLIYRIGAALGADNVVSFDELRPVLREGLYYLDNLESVIETADGQHVLRKLREQPGVRLLASSRARLPAELGRPITIGPLESESALQLFRDLWTGEPLLEDTEALRLFLARELGNHALSITLTARLGDSYSFPALVERWNALGPTLATDILYSDSRHGSLTVSLALTAESLRSQPGALLLWTLAALFSDGIAEEVLTALERSASLGDAARQRLSRHHIWTLRNGRFVLLPPVARYAIDEASKEHGGFSWVEAGSDGFVFFEPLASVAANIASSDEALSARALLLGQFGAIARLLVTEARQEAPRRELLATLNALLLNQYQFRAAQARELLRVLIPQLPNPAAATKVLGDLEGRLGSPDEARRLYERALELFRGKQDGLGQANTLRSLGNLESRLGRFDEERRLYEQALELFLGERDGLGQANTLCSLGNLQSRLGRSDEARRLYEQALELYRGERDGLGQANTLRCLGNLESRVGRSDEARRLYEQALELYRGEQVGLGQANTLQSLGDLERSGGDMLAALGRYEDALTLYSVEQEPMGTAYTWAEVARCHHARTDNDARDKALLAAIRASMTIDGYVQGYVISVLIEITGSKEGAQSWLERFAGKGSSDSSP